jgi:hypothetical protein
VIISRLMNMTGSPFRKPAIHSSTFHFTLNGTATRRSPCENLGVGAEECRSFQLNESRKASFAVFTNGFGPILPTAALQQPNGKGRSMNMETQTIMQIAATGR